MRKSVGTIAIVGVLSLAFANSALAWNGPGRGTVVVPESSIEHSGDAGVRVHTNVRMFVPEGGFTTPRPLTAGPPFSGYFYETPASIGCLYHLTPFRTGCNPNVVRANPTRGRGAIAIVDAYDDVNAASDLATFSAQFGLNGARFTVIYASGTEPPQAPRGWELEESLDIEWAHAMAPNAAIYLVEAASNSYADMLTAESVASSLAGVGEVSNSWGSGEFPGETSFDSFFATPGVVYFASSGDGPGVEYPSASPNVVSAGGTTISRNPVTGAFQEETVWTAGGSGPSSYESRPSYQSSIASMVGNSRGTPDLSSDSDPSTGVWVYDSGLGGWLIVGGTSVASPTLAGIVNSAGHFYGSTKAELTAIYGHQAGNFNDIKCGTCYFHAGYLAKTGWDFCTGVGSDYGKFGK